MVNASRFVLVALLSVLAATTESAKASGFVDDIDISSGITVDEANQKVEELFKNSTIVKKEYFCVKRELTCRTHYTLADLDGKILNAFYVRFVAVDRSVGGNGYFFPLKNRPTEFVRFEDFSYDGKVNINSVEISNVVTVEKTKRGSLQAIRGILTPKLGTTKVTNADIIVSGKSTILEGITTDTADSTFSQKSKIEYLRTRVTR